MSRIDDILSNAALQEQPDVLDEREPKDRFHYVFMCEMMIDEDDMHQYSRALCHIMNQHTIVNDYEIVERYTARYDNITYKTEEIGYIFGFSLFFNLNENDLNMYNLWELIWSISCYNNGLLLHNHSIWMNNWNDTQQEFNSGEDILNTTDMINLFKVFIPNFFAYTESLEGLIFKTKYRYEIMEFRGFHRVRLNNRKYNTKEELIISGRDALEIQEKWWLGRSIINRYIFEANRTLVTETYANEVQKLLEYLVKNVDHSDKRCKLGNSHKMDEFVKGMTLEDIEGYDSIIIGTVRFLEKITIDDDGNIIRL